MQDEFTLETTSPAVAQGARAPGTSPRSAFPFFPMMVRKLRSASPSDSLYTIPVRALQTAGLGYARKPGYLTRNDNIELSVFCVGQHALELTALHRAGRGITLVVDLDDFPAAALTDRPTAFFLVPRA